MRVIETTVDGAKVKVGQGDAAQLELGMLSADLTQGDLVRWLDREVHQPDIPQAHLRAFLQAVVAHLANEQRVALASLARVRHVLAQRVAARIEELRTAAAGRRFKQLVLDAGWDLSVAAERSFEFRPGAYAMSWGVGMLPCEDDRRLPVTRGAHDGRNRITTGKLEVR